VEKYGTDTLRYYLLAKISPFEDSDFTFEKFEEAYNGELANGLGNLVARVAKMAESTDGYYYEKNSKVINSLFNDVETELLKYRFDNALSIIWGTIKGTDEYLSRERPWTKDLSDENQKLSKFVNLTTAIENILEVAYCLKPFLPETAEKIEKQFKGPKIKAESPLFPRLV
jgi:methionyl-tRNA synthetase